MSCIKITISAFCVAVCFITSLSTLNAEPIAFEKQLPTTTYAYFRISDVALLKTKFQQTVLWKFMQDPEMKPFLSQFEGKANEKWTEISAQVQENLGVSLNQLLDIPQGEFSIALFTPPRKDLAIAIKISYGKNEGAVKGVLGKVCDSLKEDGSEIGSVDSHGMTLTTIKFVDSEEANVVYGLKDSQLVMTSSLAAMEALLERWEGQAERTFSMAANRMAVVESLKTTGETALIEWYLNPIDLTRVSAKYAGEGAAAINMGMGFLPIIGLDQLKAIGGYMDFNCNNLDGVIKTQFVVDTPLKGLMNFFLFPEDELTPPAYVNENVLSYEAFNWDVASAYTAVESVVDSFQGPGALEAMIDDIANGPQLNGIHIKKEIFDNITGKFVMTSVDAEEASAISVNYFATLGVKDASIAKGLLEKFAKMDGLVESTEIAGQYAVELPDSIGLLEDNPVKFVVAGKNELIFSATKTQVEAFLQGTSEGKTLASSTKFEKFRKMIPEKVSMLIMEMASSKQMEKDYNLVKENGLGEMLEDIPVDEIRELLEGIDFSKLPDVSILKKYYSANAAYIKSNTKGSALNYIFLKN